MSRNIKGCSFPCWWPTYFMQWQILQLKFGWWLLNFLSLFSSTIQILFSCMLRRYLKFLPWIFLLYVLFNWTWITSYHMIQVVFYSWIYDVSLGLGAVGDFDWVHGGRYSMFLDLQFLYLSGKKIMDSSGRQLANPINHLTAFFVPLPIFFFFWDFLLSGSWQIFQNYEDILRMNKFYLQEKGKLKIVLSGLLLCLSQLLFNKREDDSAELVPLDILSLSMLLLTHFLSCFCTRYLTDFVGSMTFFFC